MVTLAVTLAALPTYTSPTITPQDALKELVPAVDEQMEVEVTVAENAYLKLTVKASSTFSAPGSSHSITLKGDGVEASLKGMLSTLGVDSGNIDATINQLGKTTLLTDVKDGRLTLSLDVNMTGTSTITLSFTVWETDKGPLNSNLVIAYKLSLNTQKYLSDGLKLTAVVIAAMSITGFIAVVAPMAITAATSVPAITSAGLSLTEAATLIMTSTNPEN